MMKMHGSLVDAVADVSADLPALVAASRKQGMGLRRRRRALASVGAAAAVVTVTIGGYAVTTAVHGGGTPTPMFAASPTSGATAPLTGRMVAAALASSVDSVADGSFSEFRGDGSDDPMGEFLFAPTSGGAPGLVQIDLQRLSSYGIAKRYTCSAAYMHDCHVERFRNGDTLRTYTDDESGSARGYRRYVAEVLSPRRDLRLVVSAANTQQDEKQTVRAEPVLTSAQLRTIALQPWWDRKRLPVEFVGAGRRLPTYASLTAPTS